MMRPTRPATDVGRATANGRMGDSPLYWPSGVTPRSPIAAAREDQPRPTAARRGGTAARRLPDASDRTGRDLERIPKPVVGAGPDPHLPDMPGGARRHARLALHLPETAALVRPAARRAPGRRR